MTDALIFGVALLTLACAILATLYFIVRDAPPHAAAILSSASPVELQIKNPPLDYISRGLQARLRGHCVEAAWLDLEEPECASGEARGGGGLGALVTITQSVHLALAFLFGAVDRQTPQQKWDEWFGVVMY